jgi:hypothetical protein
MRQILKFERGLLKHIISFSPKFRQEIQEDLLQPFYLNKMLTRS